MSRVFAATENSLGRRVVIKVLPPELAEGLSIERFKREIQLSARLQNAHIVPVLTAGEVDGVPYYTMPFVAGQSLRSRLLTVGALPIDEVVSTLRDVARALASAHQAGVVHRDIKPDNVLLSGGSAVVTDFGVAKALSHSKGADSGETLTHVGTSLGTPAYMAPEQAAADADVDHRADIYAFGVMAYELLTGHPPFHGRTPQKLLAAQMGERPVSIAAVRAETPPLLAQLIMKCLEKEPNDRPRSVTELMRALEQATIGDSIRAMPTTLHGGRRGLGRALLLYAVVFAAVVIVARAATITIGLPTWVFPTAVALMILGLPTILTTAVVHHGVQRAMTTAATTTGGTGTKHSTMTKFAVKAAPWVSWPRVAIGGGISLVGLALSVVVFMLMRAYGIGPAGSLLASGKLDAKDRLLVADFRSSGSDTSLGSVMTEAVRTDLEQSSTVSLMSQSAVSEALRRMQRPDTSRLDVPLAREIAQREGLGAVVDGEIRPLGSGFVLTLRLISAQSGDALTSYQERIDGTRELLPAIDRLTIKLRGKIGESLKAVQASPGLERVTTPSLAALKLYDAGVRAAEVERDYNKAIRFFEQAVAQDTEFAMAYRKLGIVLGVEERPSEETDSAFARAYRFRDHLTERERNLATASYFFGGPGHDRRRATAAVESVLAADSNDGMALPYLAYIEKSRRDFAHAEILFKRMAGIARNSTDSLRSLSGLWAAQIDQGKIAESAATLTTARKHFGDQGLLPLYVVAQLYAAGHEDSAVRQLTSMRDDKTNDPRFRADAMSSLSDIARMHGRLVESSKLSAAADAFNESRGLAPSPHKKALDLAGLDVWYRDEKRRAAALLDSSLAHTPLRALRFSDRRYRDFINVYALAGRPDKARAIYNRFREDSKDSANFRDQEPDLHDVLGEIALAEKRYPDAILEFQRSDRGDDGPYGECSECRLPDIGRAYDAAGETDSTIALFERYLASVRDISHDAAYLAGIHKRLGELYDARGHLSKAESHYESFVELWKNADPDIQPKVKAVRERVAYLRALEHP